MNKKLYAMALVLMVVLSVLLSTGCAGTQVTDTGTVIKSNTDDTLYTVKIELESFEDYSTLNGHFSGYNGYSSGSIWEDGKGLVRGTLLSAIPSVDYVSVEDTIVIKTTDRKVKALLPGDTATFYCVNDYEPVCSVVANTGQKANCIELWEFDYCRLVSIE